MKKEKSENDQKNKLFEYLKKINKSIIKKAIEDPEIPIFQKQLLKKN